MAGIALDIQQPVQQVNALAHAGQTQTGPVTMTSRVKTLAVVMNPKLQSAVQRPDGQLYSICLGVTGAIL